MPRRKKEPKRRIIRLYTNKMPEIMPWLDAQENQSMSVYMLIRMAQQLYGNANWPDIMQSLADKSISSRLSTHRKHVPHTIGVHGKEASSNAITGNASHQMSTSIDTTYAPNIQSDKSFSHRKTSLPHELDITSKKDKNSSKRHMNNSDLKNILG